MPQLGWRYTLQYFLGKAVQFFENRAIMTNDG